MRLPWGLETARGAGGSTNWSAVGRRGVSPGGSRPFCGAAPATRYRAKPPNRSPRGSDASLGRVGDAKSRWGSCSVYGAIRYNWRLILAPPAVRR